MQHAINDNQVPTRDISDNSFKSPFYKELWKEIQQLGGMFNAHLHLDRAGTIDRKYLKYSELNPYAYCNFPLANKHNLIPEIHNGPAYDREDLSERINFYLDIMTARGTARANTLVDVTRDRVGLTALEVMLEIKKQRSQKIDLLVGVYSPFGFKDTEPERWDLLVQGALRADFIGSLPERDDTGHYPSHIGFYENCSRILELGQQLKKPVHIHIDQRNDPAEKGTEIFLQAANSVGTPHSATGEPMVWLVHVISPSAYSETRFKKLLKGLVRHNTGVICCPSAALSMQQYRQKKTPTHNSIARVLEMLAFGIWVRIGSDNIADIFSPSGTPDLHDEIFVLSNAIRFYRIGILSKIACGIKLDDDDRFVIRHHLSCHAVHSAAIKH